MITLITGTPGSGKTLYTVWLLAKEVKAGRRAMVDGIKDLAVDHVDVDEPWIRRWFELATQQDLIVIDEAQRIWPPTSVSQKIAPEVEKLHVHRHMGVDFILITQHPQRISKTVRDLVGRHVHVRKLFGLNRAMLYEWDHCHNIGSLKDAVKTMWAYPRNVFKLYTSAEVHTKQKAVIPKALFVLPIALLVAGLLAYRAVGSVHGAAWNAHAVGGGPVSGSGDAPGAASSGASMAWRVVGRYERGSRSFVVLASRDGWLRLEDAAGFVGEGVRTVGKVDGSKVSDWSATGPVSPSTGVAK